MTELFLLAQIAGRAVAIRSNEIESVVDIGEIIPVARADRRVLGLAALRSRVMTVIDARIALGEPGMATSRTRAVVAIFDGHPYAITVDALDDIWPCEMLPLANGVAIAGNWGPAAVGVIERDGEQSLVIDLRALVPGLAAAA